MNQYNIYLDESSIDNPNSQYMIIGGVFLKRSFRDQIKEDIKVLRKKYSFYPEIKWTKVNKKYIDFYKEIIDMFFRYDEDILQFHSIIIDKTLVAYDIFHSEDKELAFYKFIYQLLQNKLHTDSEYFLFLDFKQNSNPDRIKDLHKFLGIIAQKKYQNTSIKHTQSYCSKQVELIQIADLLTGAVGFSKNHIGSSHAKHEVSKYIATKLHKENLDFRSPKMEQKFNIFQINL